MVIDGHKPRPGHSHGGKQGGGPKFADLPHRDRTRTSDAYNFCGSPTPESESYLGRVPNRRIFSRQIRTRASGAYNFPGSRLPKRLGIHVQPKILRIPLPRYAYVGGRRGWTNAPCWPPRGGVGGWPVRPARAERLPPRSCPRPKVFYVVRVSSLSGGRPLPQWGASWA